MSINSIELNQTKNTQKVIKEHDAVREIIISLQGRSSILFEERLSDQNLLTIIVRACIRFYGLQIE